MSQNQNCHTATSNVVEASAVGVEIDPPCYVPAVPPPSYVEVNPVVINERGTPPSYEEVIDPNAPPPSYDSLFGRMREARKRSKGVFEFLKNIIMLLLGTIGFTIVLGLFAIIPISMIIIGGLYINDCPLGSNIPIYLIVGGGFAIFKHLLDCCTAMKLRLLERDTERTKKSRTQKLVECLMIMWFILGSMWVYREYEPNYNPALGKYCNKTLYLFAFWLITFTYICLGCFCVLPLIFSVICVLIEQLSV
ncbi:transmembrane protein 272-like [Prorops nasuta]|uniref:transmembrane protein 272-like n=1 Tax=Prorops nasuta TaxID=863751 RepID=UPI0034CD94B9